MKRIDDKTFVRTQCNPDNVIGIRIKNGALYFLAWMEDAAYYKIQQAMCSDGYLLNKATLVSEGDIYACIQETKEYNSMYLLYELDDEENLINDEDKVFANAHDKFLSIINCKENTHEHTILLLTPKELAEVCDLLGDGDYILIMEN